MLAYFLCRLFLRLTGMACVNNQAIICMYMYFTVVTTSGAKESCNGKK